MVGQVLHGKGLELAEVLEFSPHEVIEPVEPQAGTRRDTVATDTSAASKSKLHEAFFCQLLCFQYFERHKVSHKLPVFLEHTENHFFH